MEPAVIQSAEPPTSAALQSPPLVYASRPSIIASLTGLGSAVAVCCTCGPLILDNALPGWVRMWAAAMITLVSLPPPTSLALIGNAASVLSAWRGGPR